MFNNEESSMSFVCLCGVYRPTRRFFTNGNVTITGEGLQIFTYARHSCVSLLWHGPTLHNGHLWWPVTQHLLPSVWQWSSHYLFLRPSVATGDRTPIRGGCLCICKTKSSAHFQPILHQSVYNNDEKSLKELMSLLKIYARSDMNFWLLKKTKIIGLLIERKQRKNKNKTWKTKKKMTETHYLCLRLRSVATGGRTPISRMRVGCSTSIKSNYNEN